MSDLLFFFVVPLLVGLTIYAVGYWLVTRDRPEPQSAVEQMEEFKVAREELQRAFEKALVPPMAQAVRRANDAFKEFARVWARKP